MTNHLIYKDEAYKIIGAAMTVHRELGHGFLEAVYQEALEIELIDHNIPFQREVFMPVMYKGTLLQKNYIADFICYSKSSWRSKHSKPLTAVMKHKC